jgi:hypothetical protein
VFDRASLRARYKLECIDDSWEADPSQFSEFWRAKHDEFEEQVWGRNVEIAPHLIGLISAPIEPLFPKGSVIKRAMEPVGCCSGTWLQEGGAANIEGNPLGQPIQWRDALPTWWGKGPSGSNLTLGVRA